ncbi:MAG: hypothetical protein AAB410_02570 [Patescibacteria group bacterium]
MRIVYAPGFAKEFKRLPQNIQTIFYRQEKFLLADWRDPRLHTKKLAGSAGSFSFRITRNYRVIFSFPEKEVVLFETIGDRKDIYR